jgi:hypothetical protein
VTFAQVLGSVSVLVLLGSGYPSLVIETPPERVPAEMAQRIECFSPNDPSLLGQVIDMPTSRDVAVMAWAVCQDVRDQAAE